VLQYSIIFLCKSSITRGFSSEVFRTKPVRISDRSQYHFTKGVCVLTGIITCKLLVINWCVAGRKCAFNICQMRRDALNRSIVSRILFSFFLWRFDPIPGHGLPFWASRSRSETHTNTLGKIRLDELSVRRRDLYLTTHNTHKRQASVPPAGFEPTIPASERPQTRALDRAATGIGIQKYREL